MSCVVALFVGKESKSFKTISAYLKRKRCPLQKNWLPTFNKIRYHKCLLLVMKLLGREKEPWVEGEGERRVVEGADQHPFQERNLKHGRNLKKLEA